jgi:Uma2 family endonuclease
MTTVIHGENLEVDALIERRRALGQDGHDEIWEGVYHVIPDANMRHVRVQADLMRVLSPRVEARGWYVTQEFNLGDSGDFRVPDLGVHSRDVTDLYVPTAEAVIEVLSPGDQTYQKFGFYHARSVPELIVVDPIQRSVECWGRAAEVHQKSDAFLGADLTAAELTKLIRRP